MKYSAGAGFVIIGAHTDSPCPKLKPITKSAPKVGFQTIGVEPYGGGLWYTWFDRDLSVAGRAVVRRADGRFVHELVQINRRGRKRTRPHPHPRFFLSISWEASVSSS